MEWQDSLTGLLTAFGLGLLIGTVRERLHKPVETMAGMRTHTLVALLGSISWGLGMPAFVTGLVMVGALTVVGYQQSAKTNLGMTGEVSVLVTYMLAGLAMQNPVLASSIGVVVAGILFAKEPLRRLGRELIREDELKDVLLLAAAALVILPLLPNHAIDPWGALKPYALWRIVVLVMAVGMFGHIAFRATGTRWGFPIAGFFSGFVSSTASVVSMGRNVKEKPHLLHAASAAALLSILSSLILFVMVLGATSQALMASMLIPLVVAALALLMVTGLCLRNINVHVPPEVDSATSAFKISHALLIAATIGLVLLISAWLRALFGDSGTLLASWLVGLAEIHAAAVSVAQLAVTGSEQPESVRWGVMGILVSSALAKSSLAFATGGRPFGWLITSGSLAMVGAGSAAMWLQLNL
ncbi:MAG: hypothetical protein RI998_1441 [Pseudomonadota bacterium]|jgi:uncharacterized membrane protein (DUF4010 family)